MEPPCFLVALTLCVVVTRAVVVVEMVVMVEARGVWVSSNPHRHRVSWSYGWSCITPQTARKNVGSRLKC